MSAVDGYHGPSSDREALRQLDGEISTGRDELGVLVAELDRRRLRIFDVKAQFRQHIVEISLAGAALTAITVAAIWLAVQRARRRQSLISRASRFGTALNRMIADPKRVATGPTIPRQLLTAVAAAALGRATRTVIARGIESAIAAARHHASHPTRPSEGLSASVRDRQGKRDLTEEITARSTSVPSPREARVSLASGDS